MGDETLRLLYDLVEMLPNGRKNEQGRLVERVHILQEPLCMAIRACRDIPFASAHALFAQAAEQMRAWVEADPNLFAIMDEFRSIPPDQVSPELRAKYKELHRKMLRALIERLPNGPRNEQRRLCIRVFFAGMSLNQAAKRCRDIPLDEAFVLYARALTRCCTRLAHDPAGARLLEDYLSKRLEG